MDDNYRKDDWGTYPLKPYAEGPISPHVIFAEPKIEGNHLRDYLRVIIRRKWVILTFFTSAVIIVAAASMMTDPQYEATVTIKIGEESPLVVDLGGLQFEKVSSDYETQYKILESRSLARRVIAKLELDKSVDLMPEKKGFSVKSSLLQMTSLILPIKKAAPEPAEADGTGPSDMEDSVETGHINKFLSRLEVTPVKDSRLVAVSYRSKRPELAQKVANALAESYMEMDLDSRLETSKSVGRFLEEQIKEVRAKIESSEGALNEYSSRNEMIYLDDSQDKQSLLLKRLSELSSALSDATAERIKKEAVYKEAIESRGRHPAFTENSVIEGLTKQYASIESEYFNLLNVYTPDYPKMKSLKSQMEAIESRKEKLKADIIKAIESDYKAALKREQYLDDALRSQKREILAFQQKSIPYQILKRDVDANKLLHENLLQKLKEVDVTATQTNTSIQVLDRAEFPTLPVTPNIPRNIMLSIIVGLMGGVGLAFFMEYFDDTVRDTVEVEKKIQLPAFGVVPYYKAGVGKSEVPMIGHSLNGDPVAEAFRSIGTFILLSSSSKRPRSILITSPNEKEGKTTVCINTAIALSEATGPGIIIDADLRRPKLHRSFGVDNSAGLTTYLSNKGTIMSEGIIKKTSTEGLSLITAGPAHPNPSELLTSAKVKELLDALYPMFDFVIIDSAPATRVNECAYLSSVVDGTVLVVRAGQTPANTIEETKRIFRRVNARILGVVLNGTKDIGLRQGYYSY